MNADQTIETCRALAMQQFPESAEQRHEYHVGLLETRLREFAYRFGATALPVVDEPPPRQSAEVIDIASGAVLQLGAICSTDEGCESCQ